MSRRSLKSNERSPSLRSLKLQELNIDHKFLFTKLNRIDAKDMNQNALEEGIHKKQFMRCMKSKADLDDKVARRFWKELDQDGEGTITADTFEKWKKKHSKPTSLRHLFK